MTQAIPEHGRIRLASPGQEELTNCTELNFNRLFPNQFNCRPVCQFSALTTVRELTMDNLVVSSSQLRIR